MAMRFNDLEPSLSEESLAAINDFGFTHMTPVQASSIPQFLKNKDVCVEATTGSGKTLAFGIPIFEIIRRTLGESVPGKHDTYALIMAPTRELASQIYEVISRIAKFHSTLHATLMVGGTHVNECCTQYEEKGGHILIGTPGRILDVKNRIPTTLTFKKLEVLVLDEADTLLDMGFKDTINQLLAVLPKQRRTGLFSATQTKEVRELARAGLRNPVSISVRVQSKPGTSNNSSDNKSHQQQQLQQATPSTLDNSYIVCEYDQRPDELVNFLNAHLNQKIIVFCATCACVDYYSNMFEQIANKGQLLPSTLSVVGFHGKMIPKKRTILYKKFVSLSSGVMFSTDVAARGVDIPDVDWIVQLAAPRDPAFFVHRVGRTARAGKVGGALLFVTAEEQSYVDLLRGRGVPLRERACTAQAQHSEEDTKIETIAGTATSRSPLLREMKLITMSDRTILECGSTAFMAFLRAYKEHMCSYIFRFDQLDIGAVARSYSLLRLPKIPETRGVKGKPIDFEITNVDTSSIPYLHKEQEEARQRRLQAAYEAAAENDKKGVSSHEKRANKSAGESDSEHSDSAEPSTSKFAPHEIFLPKTKEQKKIEDQNRKRKQKGGLHKKIMEEWDDLAAEEMAYKKFKKGLISKKEYENCLFSDKKLAVDPITGQPLLREAGGGDSGDDGSSGGDDDNSDGDSSEDDSEDEKPNKKNKGKGAGKAKKQMRLKYQSESDDESEDQAPSKANAGPNKGKGMGKKGAKNGKSNAMMPSVSGGGQQRKDYRRVKSGKSFPGSSKKRAHA